MNYTDTVFWCSKCDLETKPEAVIDSRLPTSFCCPSCGSDDLIEEQDLVGGTDGVRTT